MGRLNGIAAGLLVVGLSLIQASCRPDSRPAESCEGSVDATLGIVWPDFHSIVSSNTRTTLQAARRAAELGDFDRAIRMGRRQLAAPGGGPREAGFTAAALLARYLHGGDVPSLLDAGEMLASGGEDLASRCNRLRALERLSLRYQLARGAEECSCLRELSPPIDLAATFPLDGRRHSADQLAVSELQAVEGHRARGRDDLARRRVRRFSQAWRVWLERDALELWRNARGAVTRQAVIERVLPLAEIYATASHNAVPVRLWEQLSHLPAARVDAVEEALGHFGEGMSALSRYEPDRVERELVPARDELSSSVPALLPSIDLALAAARFHLGDDRGMLARSLAVRHGVPLKEQPWAWGRALWLEAVALQAQADWSEAERRAEEARRIFEGLGELANAGYQDTVRGVGLEAQGADDEASSAFASAVARVYEAGDTRLLAGSLALFARQQSRVGRPHLAVELQWESTLLDSADATPQLVTEAKALLAEQLFRAGELDEGGRALEEARNALRQIESAQPRRRAEAIVAQVESLGLRDAHPDEAEEALGRFLSTFSDFGERFFRAEALIERAEARVALSKLPEAEQDLAGALGEIARQSERLEDRIQAVILLDRAREALDLLIDVFLRTPDGVGRSLDWIERLRAEQIGRGFGSGNSDAARRASLERAPANHCITEYWATVDQLLAWTSCDGAPPHMVRTKVDREELLQGLREFRDAAQWRDLDELRRLSAVVSTWLVAPLGKDLATSVSWTVVPDALFPGVPFAWLTLGGRFVFEGRVVKTAPSWSQLTPDSSTQTLRWRALGFGDADPAPESPRTRLPFARREVERLASTFPGSVARVGAAATWSGLLEERGSFNLLHLATHVSSGSRVPLSARLELSPDLDRIDGRVSADEVARVRFPGLRLAVVASCSSGTAAPTKIGGSLDFAHAFLSAGAEEVLGTLWSVPDRETSVAMGELYENLEAGLTPEQALRQVWRRALENEPGPAGTNVRAALQLSSVHP